MYTYNQNKQTYIKIAETLEIYKLSTKIPLSYNNDKTDQLSEKDFDHIKQLISIYGKILFFTKPAFKDSLYSFKFGVEQENLFKQGDNPVGVLQQRLDKIILFNDTINTLGNNINTYITKEH
jgi:hypothetical protein